MNGPWPYSDLKDAMEIDAQQRVRERTRHEAARRSTRTCVPGMAQSESGESPDARYRRSRRLGEGQGRHREVGSEGSPIQKRGARYTNRIRGVARSGRAGT